jgi:hypothetical protein
VNIQSWIDIFAAICLALAIVHTFSVKRFQHLAVAYAKGTVRHNIFHLLGEVEVVFGFWAAIFLLFIAGLSGFKEAIEYLETRNFTEPAFVFVVMTVCSSRPVLRVANQLIEIIASMIPVKKSLAFFVTVLIIGPLLGSLITEPAAMTVTALLLLERFYDKGISQKLMYTTIGLLFVNVSIGGVLTPFAAPPVLMVAPRWNWGFGFMLTQFGWKAVIAITASTLFVAYRFRHELSSLKWDTPAKNKSRDPIWVSAVHLVFLGLIVMTSHHLIVFLGLFLFFLGLVSVTRHFHHELKLREGLLVGFFLGGLVVLGGRQHWWLEPILTQFGAGSLYMGAMGLTAFTDNAALTFLGSQVGNLTDPSKYFLVAGAVAGGGLTVIANAPNPAGYGILNRSSGDEGISPLLLFTHALIPTAIAGCCFWFF